jgi:hypothetical protein
LDRPLPVTLVAQDLGAVHGGGAAEDRVVGRVRHLRRLQVVLARLRPVTGEVGLDPQVDGGAGHPAVVGEAAVRFQRLCARAGPVGPSEVDRGQVDALERERPCDLVPRSRGVAECRLRHPQAPFVVPEPVPECGLLECDLSALAEHAGVLRVPRDRLRRSGVPAQGEIGASLPFADGPDPASQRHLDIRTVVAPTGGRERRFGRLEPAEHAAEVTET